MTTSREAAEQRDAGRTHRREGLPSDAVAREPARPLARGRPLDPATRMLMETRFGRDLGGVRVHTGEEAIAAGRAVGARAFTFGRDVVIGDPSYRPQTHDGRRLIAHELAHVVQQRLGPEGRAVGPKGAEAEARAASGAVARGGPADVTVAGAGVQREEPDDETLRRLRTARCPSGKCHEPNRGSGERSLLEQFPAPAIDRETILGMIRAQEQSQAAEEPQPASEPRAPAHAPRRRPARKKPPAAEWHPLVPAPEAAPSAPVAEEWVGPRWTLGSRGERIPVPGYRGPLRPVEEYKKPIARSHAENGNYEAAELAEFYMCPTCHVGTQVAPRDFNLRGYVESYEEGYMMAGGMLLTAAAPFVLPESVLVAIGGYTAGVSGVELVTGESSGAQIPNLVTGNIDTGRKLSTGERVLRGVDVATFGIATKYGPRAPIGRKPPATPPRTGIRAPTPEPPPASLTPRPGSPASTPAPRPAAPAAPAPKTAAPAPKPAAAPPPKPAPPAPAPKAAAPPPKAAAPAAPVTKPSAPATPAPNTGAPATKAAPQAPKPAAAAATEPSAPAPAPKAASTPTSAAPAPASKAAAPAKPKAAPAAKPKAAPRAPKAPPAPKAAAPAKPKPTSKTATKAPSKRGGKPSAKQRKGSAQTPAAPTRTETIEEFKARGGKVTKLPPGKEPKGVTARPKDVPAKDQLRALGEGPQRAAVNEATKSRAGAGRPPRHHVFPQEKRSWFQRRGFRGKHDIDQYTIPQSQGEHQAIHGGGKWKLGREWEGEWNNKIMDHLRKAERLKGSRLTRDEIIAEGRKLMRKYGLKGRFKPYKGE